METEKTEIFNMMWKQDCYVLQSSMVLLKPQAFSTICFLTSYYVSVSHAGPSPGTFHVSAGSSLGVLHRTLPSHNSLLHNHSDSCGSKWGVYPWSPNVFLQPRPVFSGLDLYLWLPYCYCRHDAQILKFRMSLTELTIYMPPTCFQACLSTLHATLSPPFSLSHHHSPCWASHKPTRSRFWFFPSNQILLIPPFLNSLFHYMPPSLSHNSFSWTACTAIMHCPPPMFTLSPLKSIFHRAVFWKCLLLSSLWNMPVWARYSPLLSG